MTAHSLGHNLDGEPLVAGVESQARDLEYRLERMAQGAASRERAVRECQILVDSLRRTLAHAHCPVTERLVARYEQALEKARAALAEHRARRESYAKELEEDTGPRRPPSSHPSRAEHNGKNAHGLYKLFRGLSMLAPVVLVGACGHCGGTLTQVFWATELSCLTCARAY